MRTTIHQVTFLVSEGRLTLQIPEFRVGDKVKQAIIVPDHCFCMLKADKTPCIGREKGLLYLTQEGFRHFHKDLKTALTKVSVGEDWPAFVKHADDHFAMVEKQRIKRKVKLEKDLLEISFFRI